MDLSVSRKISCEKFIQLIEKLQIGKIVIDVNEFLDQ